MRVGFKVLTQNEDGYALLVTMLLLTLMTVIGIAATNTATTEMQIAVNQKGAAECFYDTEGLLVDTLEASPNWIPGIVTGSIPSSHSIIRTDIDGDGTEDFLVEIRCIEQTGSTIAALTPFADDVPVDVHMANPHAGDDVSSMNLFTARRFAVTVTNNDCNARVQSGVWKVFNKP